MPFITISRMYGSGGSEVADLVAKRLGWTLYDNQLVDAIALKSGLPAAEVAAAEDRSPSLVERISGAFTLGTPEAMPVYVERTILELRYGLGGGQQHTLEEVGRRFGVTRERVRQIETRTLRRLAAAGEHADLRHLID